MRRKWQTAEALLEGHALNFNSANRCSIFVDGWGDRGDLRPIRRSVPVGMNPPASHRERMTHAEIPVGVSAGFALLLGIETYPMAFDRGADLTQDVADCRTQVATEEPGPSG